jgi:hypothetical protein
MKVPLAMAVSLLLAVSAEAQPPPQGWIGALSKPSILCDTSAQVQSIVEAFAHGTDAGAARFFEFFRLMNAKHEPTCAIVTVSVAETGESQTLGHLRIGGGDFYGWILHVENRVGDGYYLYLESPAEALKNSI